MPHYLIHSVGHTVFITFWRLQLRSGSATRLNAPTVRDDIECYYTVVNASSLLRSFARTFTPIILSLTTAFRLHHQFSGNPYGTPPIYALFNRPYFVAKLITTHASRPSRTSDPRRWWISILMSWLRPSHASYDALFQTCEDEILPHVCYCGWPTC